MGLAAAPMDRTNSRENKKDFIKIFSHPLTPSNINANMCLMLVKIKKYKKFIGPYQIVDWFKKVGLSEERADKIGEWLAETWVSDLCQWIETKRNRKEYIRIDPYDTWSMDHTLSLIVHPMLVQLKETKHGAPFVDDEDVPDELRTSAAPAHDEFESDHNWFKRWDYVLDEMIFAFEHIKDPSWTEAFHSGESDTVFVPLDKDGNETTEDEVITYRLEKGPNDTHVFDIEGQRKVEDRIQNGLRLFGKYFRCLWD